MTITVTRQQRRALEKDNLRWPEKLREVPPDQWPLFPSGPAKPVRVLRSREFLVQVYTVTGGGLRLTANRSTLRGDGRWDDRIEWDELQRLKAEAGYGTCWALEVYPPDDEVVNVGNLRHLWLLPCAPAFAWRRQP